jgi:hypothetical protein
MALRRTSYLPSVISMVLCCLLSVVHAQVQENRNVARVVVWQAKQGMVRDLEEGYKRHLGWHRHNGDSWTWHGWTIISGERFGYFIDGTFFHRWSELDSPVSPGADAADNAENVFPYGDVRSAAIYEGIPQVTNLDSKDLTSTLLTFCYFDVEPGRNAEFEALVGERLQGNAINGIRYSVLRPETGISEYLLLLPADKQSELRAQSELIAQLLQALSQAERGIPLVRRFRTEAARYRPDLSYVPGQTVPEK